MPRIPPDDERCQAETKAGGRCPSRVDDSGTHCHNHNPDVPHVSTSPPDDRRCTATATGGTTRPERKGLRCEQWAMKGQTVCQAHGGKARQSRIAGLRRVAEAELEQQAAHLVGTPVENPLTELAALAGRARAWMEL